MKWIFNGYMMWGALIGGLIFGSIYSIRNAVRHEGSGVVEYGDGDGGPEYSENVSEEEYKRHHYTMGVMMLSVSIILWLCVAHSAKETNSLVE